MEREWGLSGVQEIYEHSKISKNPPKYLHFLDSDDYLSLDCVSECMRAVCKEDIDLLIYGSANFIDSRFKLEEDVRSGGFLGLFKDIQEGRIYSGCELLGGHINGRFLAFSVGCQIRFEMIKNVRFVEGVIGEDALFAPLFISNVGSASFLKKTFYQRRIRPLSASDFGNQHTKQTLPPSLDDISQTMRDIEDVKLYYYAFSCACYCREMYVYFFLQNHFSEAVRRKVNDFILDRISIAFEALHFESDPRNARARLDDLRSFLKERKLSSKIAYHFPRIFKILKRMKKKVKKWAQAR